ncbi:MAG: two-component system, OmpR family, phosphate regulon sensor histidine kinase PhoR [Methyloprofundus sp.]|nr:MAG: two-component system, OmpR family, phosphate regulon sensor histidine kinase PhoR [Methyloprofundus sp.]
MNFWYRDLLLFIATFLMAAIISFYTGNLFLVLLLVCIVFIIRQTYLLYQLEQWLQTGAKKKPPNHGGIWQQIYQHIARIKKLTKKRKNSLRPIIEQFRKSTAALPDAVVVLEKHDEVSWFNGAARTMLGLKKGDKGQRIHHLINDPAFIEFLNHKNQGEILTIPSPANDQETLQIKIVNYGENSYSHLLVAHDVTYLKNIERMRKDFVDNISHELRTPLTVLKGYLETLDDLDDQKSALLTHSLQQMSDQTLRMQYLVDDLLLLADLETKKIENQCVEIAPLLKQICLESGALEQLNNRIELFIDSDINIVGNPKELRSAFSNLIVNALKYSPPDSIVTVQWHQSEHAVILDIIDQGEGIPALEIPKITERFYRVDVKRPQEQRGTGLGLAIVKHTLTRHNAQLNITSEWGKGSYFSCVFPKKRFC